MTPSSGPSTLLCARAPCHDDAPVFLQMAKAITPQGLTITAILRQRMFSNLDISSLGTLYQLISMSCAFVVAFLIHKGSKQRQQKFVVSPSLLTM
eukprot:4161527-Ditylum_brightwellii.AAC.1